ncbi:MAG: transposase, partial [Parvularculaceae bacterium]|nr:transposase [Parvularculaceae bacterium]
MIPAALPDDLGQAHALIRELTERLAEKEEAVACRDAELARLGLIIKKLQRLQFGAKSEKLDPDQLALGLEDLEAAVSAAEAEAEGLGATSGLGQATRRRPLSIATRKTARARIRRAISKLSAAFCRRTAMPASTRSTRKASCAKPPAGRMRAASSSTCMSRAA